MLTTGVGYNLTFSANLWEYQKPNLTKTEDLRGIIYEFGRWNQGFFVHVQNS